MDFSISVQTEHAMLGRIKASARDALSRTKRGHPPRAKMSWPLSATESEELSEWRLTASVNVAASS